MELIDISEDGLVGRGAAWALIDGGHHDWIEGIPPGIPRGMVIRDRDAYMTPVVVDSVLVTEFPALRHVERLGYIPHRVERSAEAFVDAMNMMAEEARAEGIPTPESRNDTWSDRIAECHTPLDPRWRCLVVSGHGGPYGILAQAWIDAAHRCGMVAAMGLGEPTELMNWEPDLVIVLYPRSAWSRNRDFFRCLVRAQIPTAYLCYEDPYETKRFHEILSAVMPHHPSVALTTDPAPLLSGAYKDLNVWYAPHCWSPIWLPDRKDHAESLGAMEEWRKHRPPLEVATIGHNYATRFEFFAHLPYLWKRFKWLTVGADYWLNTEGMNVRGLPFRKCVALCQVIGLHVVHHRDLTTSHGKWTWPVSATNMNMTLVQMAAAGVAQVTDWRPTVEYHFSDRMPTYRSPQELLDLLEKLRSSGKGYLASRQQHSVLSARSTYADRLQWIADNLGIRLPVKGTDLMWTSPSVRNWDPIRVDNLAQVKCLCQAGIGAVAGPAGKVVL